jgi:serine/threonine protein kinase
MDEFKYANTAPLPKNLLSNTKIGGELFEYILARRYLKERDAKRLFAQLISGVRYMHEKHIVHRDLKLVGTRLFFVRRMNLVL